MAKASYRIHSHCRIITVADDYLVIIKNPSDFIGSVIGASEVNTKAILAASIGKVLIIDEAYMLSGSSKDGGSSGADVYKTAVIIE
jgi:histidinol-phosphate/aromatic aminotransferase/cobyric acid decarboxylase-like protein